MIAITLGIGKGAAVLFYGLKYLSISMREYSAVVLRRPLNLLVALLAGLLAVRIFSPYPAGLTLIIGAATVGIVSLVVLRDDISAVVRSLRNA